MVPDLVSLADARAHLRLEADSNGGPDDGWLALFIPAISNAIVLWLKEDWRLYALELDSSGDTFLDSNDEPVIALDSNGDSTLLPAVRAACLLELDRQYRFRDGGAGETDVPSEHGHGYTLGRGATALLTPLRLPTLG